MNKMIKKFSHIKNTLCNSQSLFKVYLVGGCVRDILLDYEVNDFDWAVEINKGVSTQEVIDFFEQNGFIKVGKDFPVYLHPKTNEEYSFCRTERKTGIGYTSFDTNIENVSIEEDLLRRDLTINSIAFCPVLQEFHFPLGVTSCLKDIKSKTLRPTSSYFVEDPLRFLRVCRFSAKNGNFKIDFDSFKSFRPENMVKEFKSISKERVVAEMNKAFEYQFSDMFFRNLKELNILQYFFPEVYSMIGLEQPVKHHAEGDVFEHSMWCLREGGRFMSIIKNNKQHSDRVKAFKFACLFHDIGKVYNFKNLQRKLIFNKSLSNEEKIAKLNKEKFYGHDSYDLNKQILSSWYDRYLYPKKYLKFTLKAASTHHFFHNVKNLSDKKIAKFFCDSKYFFHDRNELVDISNVAKCDCFGRICCDSENAKVLNFKQSSKAWKNIYYKNGKFNYTVGEFCPKPNYNYLIDLYDFLNDNKISFTPNKKIINSLFLDNNGKICEEKKNNWIYKQTLKLVKQHLKENER